MRMLSILVCQWQVHASVAAPVSVDSHAEEAEPKAPWWLSCGHACEKLAGFVWIWIVLGVQHWKGLPQGWIPLRLLPSFCDEKKRRVSGSAFKSFVF